MRWPVCFSSHLQWQSRVWWQCASGTSWSGAGYPDERGKGRGLVKSVFVGGLSNFKFRYNTKKERKHNCFVVWKSSDVTMFADETAWLFICICENLCGAILKWEYVGVCLCMLVICHLCLFNACVPGDPAVLCEVLAVWHQISFHPSKSSLWSESVHFRKRINQWLKIYIYVA